MTYCVACGQECTVIEVDYGIGTYEYWGSICVDKDVKEVSSCCEEDFTYEPSEKEEDDD
jgi:hypothetical protein